MVFILPVNIDFGGEGVDKYCTYLLEATLFIHVAPCLRWQNKVQQQTGKSGGKWMPRFGLGPAML